MADQSTEAHQICDQKDLQVIQSNMENQSDSHIQQDYAVDDDEESWATTSSSSTGSDKSPDYDSRDSEAESLMFHHLFGRIGHVQSQRATQYSWYKRLPFKKSHQLSWSIPISHETLLRLLHGFTPVKMEEKWFIYATGPDSSGVAQVHFHRGWTGIKIAELEIKVSWGADSAIGLWTGSIVRLTIEDEHQEWSAKEEEVIVGKGSIVLQIEKPEEDEKFIKFLVLTACQRILHSPLEEKIALPAIWKILCSRLADRLRDGVESSVQQSFRGASHSKETEEDIQRAGGMAKYFGLASPNSSVLFN